MTRHYGCVPPSRGSIASVESKWCLSLIVAPPDCKRYDIPTVNTFNSHNRLKTHCTMTVPLMMLSARDYNGTFIWSKQNARVFELLSHPCKNCLVYLGCISVDNTRSLCTKLCTRQSANIRVSTGGVRKSPPRTVHRLSRTVVSVAHNIHNLRFIICQIYGLKWFVELKI